MALEDELRGQSYVPREGHERGQGSSQSTALSTVDAHHGELVRTLEAFLVDRTRLLEKALELHSIVEAMVAMGVDVAENCPPPRIAALAHKYGLTPGPPLDIIVNDNREGP